MTILALTMEMGALSKEIAREVGRELGLRTAYDSVVDKVCEALGTTRTALGRFIEGRTGFMERLCLETSKIDALVRAELLKSALSGATLVRGWGGEHVFADVPSAARVRICAPLEQRIANLREILGVDDESFLRIEIARSDRSYASRLTFDRARERRPAFNYDLVINTGRNDVGYCVDQIVRLARQPRFDTRNGVDPALRAAALRTAAVAALKTDPRTASVDITIDVKEGRVDLLGVVRAPAERVAAEEIVRAVTGVEHVRNRLTAIRGEFKTLRAAGNY
jgi:hypothetical protein